MELLRDMALFTEVVRTRSFTAAARNLDMPPSTLSRRISGMERSLGLTLLTRTTRRVDLTDAGAAYYARCAHLVEEARVAHEEIARGAQSATGTLRLSCTPDFATLYLPPLLETYTRRHAGVNVELDLSTRTVDLMGEPLDAALRMGPLPDSSLVARRVGSLDRGLYAAPAYLAQAGIPATPADLSRHMAVRLRPGESGQTWRLHPQSPDGGEPMTVGVHGRFVAGSVAMVRELVLRGAGIGIIDARMAAQDMAQGHLVPVLPGWRLSPSPVHLLTVSRFTPARVRLFGDLLAEALGAAERQDPARPGT